MSNSSAFMPSLGSIYRERDSREFGQRFFEVVDVRHGYATGFSFRTGAPRGHRPTERRPTRIRLDVLGSRWSYVPNGDYSGA